MTGDGQTSKGPARAVVGDRHQSLNDLVREALREAILEGRFRPGDRLVEGKLATQFGVSRNPVREALKALGNEGIVTIAPRRGAIVAEMSDSEAAEVVELRAALEGIGARLAARRLEPEAAENLKRILAAGETAAAQGDTGELSRLNLAFHAELARAGHNRFLSEFMRTLRTKTQWLFDGVQRERARQNWAEHAAILRAVLDADEEMAALLASRHVTAVGRAMLAQRMAEPARDAAE